MSTTSRLVQRRRFVGALCALATMAACSREESPAVVQARAALTIAEQDAASAHQDVAIAEATVQQAEAAVVAANQEPNLVRERARAQEMGAEQRELMAERNRWSADQRIDAQGHFLRWPEIRRIDDRLRALGGPATRMRNSVQNLERPVRAAEQARQRAAAQLAHARRNAEAKDEIAARARQTLDATVQAAE